MVPATLSGPLMSRLRNARRPPATAVVAVDLAAVVGLAEVEEPAAASAANSHQNIDKLHAPTMTAALMKFAPPVRLEAPSPRQRPRATRRLRDANPGPSSFAVEVIDYETTRAVATSRWRPRCNVSSGSRRSLTGWAISANNDTALALAALHRAVRGRGFIPAGLLHHTDRGSPYTSDDYRAALASHAMIASMSRKGDCWDNAPSESFFATLRAELVDDERYTTLRAAETSIGDYIENFYNVERIHSTLDYVSPIEFELKARVVMIAA